MKKKRNKRKAVDPLVKSFILLGLVQILILFSFLIVLYQTRPIEINSCVLQTIRVDEVSYVKELRKSSCYVIASEVKYRFPNPGIFGDYSSLELSEEIQVGDTLNIIYYERSSLFGKHNEIADARDEAHIYIDFHSRNEELHSVRIALIIIFAVIELFFLCYMCAFINLERKNIFKKIKKSLKRLKSKKQAIKYQDD